MNPHHILLDVVGIFHVFLTEISMLLLIPVMASIWR